MTDLLDRMPVSSEEDLKHKEGFIESYLTASNGLLDVYNKEELTVLMAETNNAEETIPDESAAALYIAIAIGAQCRASRKLDLQYARKYFFLGQKAAFQSMVEDPDITVTRCFLLMALYLLGACQRNGAFMYLGIASKSAYALGLHVHEHYTSTTATDQNIRSRTWKSLRTLDIIITTVMGRLTSAPQMSLEPENFEFHRETDISNRELCLNATYRVTSIMDQIVHDILSSKSIDVNTAEAYLQTLNAWSATLPHDLRKFSAAPPPTLTDQEPLIGNIHVSCSYYWAVMLVTRPFLMHRMTSWRGASTRSASSGASPVDPGVNKLAHVCVWAGVHVAQNCHILLKPGSLLNNLCILKAWVFSAALVLGFSMLIPDDSSFDVQDGFAKACEVVQMLTRSSPKKERYYDVLNCFADAIHKYRQDLADKRRKLRHTLLMDILTVDIDQDTADQPPAPEAAQPLGLSGGTESQHRLDSGYTAAVSSRGQADENTRTPDLLLASGDVAAHPFLRRSGSIATPPVPVFQPQRGHFLPSDGINEDLWDDLALEISQTLPFDCGFERMS